MNIQSRIEAIRNLPRRYVYPVLVVLFAVFFRFSCLERVTGEASPLDPAYYEAAEALRGAPGEGGGASRPFSTYTGPTVTLRGTIIAEAEDESIDIDFRTADPSAPGGMAGQGKLLLDTPGEFSLPVPVNTVIQIEAFQDLDGDGPGGQDPFAQLEVVTESEDITDVALTLVPGARKTREHQEVNPEQIEGGAEHGEGVPDNPDPFGGYGGARISINGILHCGCTDRIDLDLFESDDDAPGGRRMLGKMKLDPGVFTIQVPVDYGQLIFEAFIDTDGDGPGPGDLMGVYDKNPLYVGSSDLFGIDIFLTVPDDGRMPRKEGTP